jgi:hypothetical protein
VRIGATAVRLTAAVVTYRTVDEAQARLLDTAEFVGGPALMFDTLLVVGGDIAGRMLRGESFGTAAQRVITNHPGLVDTLVGSAPGTLTVLVSLSPVTALTFALGPGLPTTVSQGAALIGGLYPDGTAKVTDLGADESITGRKPPRNVTDLMVDLDQRSAGRRARSTSAPCRGGCPTAPSNVHTLWTYPGPRCGTFPGRARTSTTPARACGRSGTRRRPTSGGSRRRWPGLESGRETR